MAQASHFGGSNYPTSFLYVNPGLPCGLYICGFHTFLAVDFVLLQPCAVAGLGSTLSGSAHTCFCSASSSEGKCCFRRGEARDGADAPPEKSWLGGGGRGTWQFGDRQWRATFSHEAAVRGDTDSVNGPGGSH
jgi:hypothetical protein